MHNLRIVVIRFAYNRFQNVQNEDLRVRDRAAAVADAADAEELNPNDPGNQLEFLFS